MLDTISPPIVCASPLSVFAMQRPRPQKPRRLDRVIGGPAFPPLQPPYRADLFVIV